MRTCAWKNARKLVIHYCKPVRTEPHMQACANTCSYSFMSAEHISQRERVLFQSASHLLGKTRSIAQSKAQSKSGEPEHQFSSRSTQNSGVQKVLIHTELSSERVSQVCDAAGGAVLKRCSWQAWLVSEEAHVSLRLPSPVRSVIGERWKGGWELLKRDFFK